MLESELSFKESFSSIFSSISDPRQSGKISYPLEEILFLTLVSISGGARGWDEISAFANSKLDILRNYYPFASGIPSDDTLRRLFRNINQEELNRSMYEMFNIDKSSLSGMDKKEIYSCDGKAVRGTKDSSNRALNIFNIYASESNLVLYASKILEKSNEITALPAALEIVDVSNSVVTADAIMCTKKIASAIVSKDAEYFLALKSNNGYLYKSVTDHFRLFYEYKKSDIYETNEINKGRKESRICKVIYDLSALKDSNQWEDIQSIVEVSNLVEYRGKITEEKRYYISNSRDSAKDMLNYSRKHWQVESMHYVMDVTFKEDASKLKDFNAAACMVIFRRIAFNILDKMKQKRESKPLLMNKIGWSNNYLEKFINSIIKN